MAVLLEACQKAEILIFELLGKLVAHVVCVLGEGPRFL